MNALQFNDALKLLVSAARKEGYSLQIRNYEILDLNDAAEQFSVELLITGPNLPQRQCIKLSNPDGAFLLSGLPNNSISCSTEIQLIFQALKRYLQVNCQAISIQQVTKDNIQEDLLDEIWEHYQLFLQSQDAMMEDMNTGVDFGTNHYTKDYLLGKFKDNYTLNILRHQDAIQGFIGWEMKDDLDLRVKDLWVHPQYRGIGRGSYLLISTQDAAFKMGALSMSLSAVSNNTAAISLYERLGFSTFQVQMIKKIGF